MDEGCKTVVVVGGSIAGLMHGIMAKRLGHNVRILEQNTSSVRANHAAGMGTGPKGHEFFKTYDQNPNNCTLSCPGISFLDKSSRVKRQLSLSMHLTSWDALYFRLRCMFDGLVSDYCPEASEHEHDERKADFELGKRVTEVSYSPTDGIVTVHCKNQLNGDPQSFQADLVIDASGAYSKIQHQLVGDIDHPYSGYVAWRGTVPETAVSQATRSLFEERCNIYTSTGSYLVGYAVPNEKGSIRPGERYLNWVWYYNLKEHSDFYVRALTDNNGHLHRNTLPVGQMNPKVWSEIKLIAAKTLNPSFLEVVQATEKPFLATIRDSASPRALFFDGHLVLVGEALQLLRPHTGMSANQAAVHCFALRKVLQGQMSIEDWECEVLEWGQKAALVSKLVAFYSLGPKLSFLVAFIELLLTLVSQLVSRLFSADRKH